LVTRLNVHNYGEQMVYFPSHENAMGKVANGRATQTFLTGFMKLNQKNAIGANGRRAQDLKYENVAEYFSWNKAKKTWIPRKSKADAVGRIYSVSFTAGEKFYMRVLLKGGLGYPVLVGGYPPAVGRYLPMGAGCGCGCLDSG
jgi:hypothetical protein